MRRLSLILLIGALGCVEDPDSRRDPDDPQPSVEPEGNPEPQPEGNPEPQPEGNPEPQPEGNPEPEPVIRVPLKHRPVEVVCDDERPAGESPGGDGEAECGDDSDCQDGRNGRCTSTRFGYECTYDACVEDADCDGVCECNGGFRSDANACTGGNCRVNADCGPQGYCSPSFGSCGGYSGVVAYYCHTPEDECIDDEDCEGDPEFGFDPYCAYEPGAGRWRCSNDHCVGK
jgi:hypothetical protein